MEINAMRNKKMIFLILSLAFLVNPVAGVGQEQTAPHNDFSINLKSQALVLGPQIKLGDIAVIEVPDSLAKQLTKVVICEKAAPPGESRELSLNYIKRCIKRAGFKKYLTFIHGPRIIRVTTAPVEIHKTYARKGFAQIKKGLELSSNPIFFTPSLH